MGKTKNKKVKKVKLESPPKIRRRIMKLWSEKVREAHGFRCAICGLKSGEVINGKPQKTDAHHIEDRRNHSLSFDFLNGICLCVRHHKFGENAAHRSLVYFSKWLQNIRPKQYEYILENRNKKIDLNSREELYKIEQRLKLPVTDEESEILNLQDVFNLEGKYELNPMSTTTTTTTLGSLFSNI